MRSTAIALILLLGAAQAAAQPIALPAGVTPVASLQASDTVHCAYDQLSTEDREMALLLLEREVGSSSKTHEDSPNLKVIDRLVGDARDKCARPFVWSSGRSSAAVAYAMNELMSEGVAQALAAKGHPVTPIEAYFQQHHSELAGLSEIAGPKAEAFRAYLLGSGWQASDIAALGIAEFYLESLLAREAETRRFAAAVKPAPVVPAKLTSRPAPAQPSRAKTARRGRN